MRRVGRGLAALAALVGGLVGMPALLLALGGNPWPEAWRVDAVLDALLRPDDGTVLVGLVTVVGWVAWLVVAVSVVTEVVNLAVRRPPLVLPGLGGVQRVAAGLLVSVVVMLTSHALAASAPPVAVAPAALEPAAAPTPPIPTPPISTPPPPTPTAPAAEARLVPAVSLTALAAEVPDPTGAGGAEPRVHVVRAGDDLWSLAERYYGRGRDWRRIAVANPGVLSGGPDRLQVGWRLVVPEDPAPPAAGTVRVRAGDTLSSIAERTLGEPTRWPELYAANRAQLDDPDELAVGQRLDLPDTPAATHPEPDRPDEPAPEREPDASAGSDPEPPATAPEGSVAESQAPPSSTAPEPVPHPTPVPAGSSGDRAAPGAGVATGLAGVGGLLAAGLLGGLAWRRRVQLHARPLGRRIVQPAPALRAAEVELGHRQRPVTLRTLDRALLAIAAQARAGTVRLPPLRLALVADHELELRLDVRCDPPPVGFTVRDRSWVLTQDDAPYLASVPGLGETGRPWPTLVSLGTDADGRQVVADLEGLGLLHLGADPAATGRLAAMAVELSFSPWAEEMTLTLVGHGTDLPDALGSHQVSRTDDVDALLDRLELRAYEQRAHAPADVLGRHRLDVDLADPWVPEVVLVERTLTPEQTGRLRALTTSTPRVPVAAVVAGPFDDAPWALRTHADGVVTLEPWGVRLTPQSLEDPGLERVVELVATTGSLDTTPAPWWSVPDAPPQPPPDPIPTSPVLTSPAPTSTHETDTTGEPAERREAMRVRGIDPLAAPQHPTLLLLGPVELLGAAGPPPPRAAKQCLEYCAWLMQNHGSSAQAMAAALFVAEGTRRSNMSRLRTWLGVDDQGRSYLPDAYTGKIRLDASVSSDWEQLQTLTTGGVDQAPTTSLERALELVRGAPLADAAPGQWHWAEELRTDMISCVRDLGVELSRRAVEAGDVDLARWAAARALVAAPGDELLLAARVRTEHLAGNVAETERLSRQLAQQARVLGVDLDPATVRLLQQVLEGRVRARTG